MRSATSREVWRVNFPTASSRLPQQAEACPANAGQGMKCPVLRGNSPQSPANGPILSHRLEGQTGGPHDCLTLRLLQHRRHMSEAKEIETEGRKLTVKWWSDYTARRLGNRSAATALSAGSPVFHAFSERIEQFSWFCRPLRCRFLSMPYYRSDGECDPADTP